MTKIEKTVHDINDLWLFYLKTSGLRRNLQYKKKPKKSCQLNIPNHQLILTPVSRSSSLY
jgi:hypothetical protein